jgi:hypothetical protein
MILSLDPGSTQSAYCVLDDNLKTIRSGKCDNRIAQEMMIKYTRMFDIRHCAIEGVQGYGMAVGKTVFETCEWIGIYLETARLLKIPNIKKIYRKEEKKNLCKSIKVKDSDIRQALIVRFIGEKVIENGDWFNGFKYDVWQAYAVGVTYYDLYMKGAI